VGVVQLPIASAAAESLGDREQLVRAAFLDAVAALRVRLREPPPYRFVMGPSTAVDRWLAVRLAEAGREVAVVATGRDGGAGPARRSRAGVPRAGRLAGRLVGVGSAGLATSILPTWSARDADTVARARGDAVAWSV